MRRANLFESVFTISTGEETSDGVQVTCPSNLGYREPFLDFLREKGAAGKFDNILVPNTLFGDVMKILRDCGLEVDYTKQFSTDYTKVMEPKEFKAMMERLRTEVN